eukprot:2178841-Pleurochrysis_carterae.AAC.1
MKKSSMKTAPKGKIPPMSIVSCAPMYHACSGTCRGISLVRTGGSASGCLKPKKAPTKTSGTEMQNHIESSATKVPNGTARRRAARARGNDEAVGSKLKRVWASAIEHIRRANNGPRKLQAAGSGLGKKKWESKADIIKQRAAVSLVIQIKRY